MAIAYSTWAKPTDASSTTSSAVDLSGRSLGDLVIVWLDRYSQTDLSSTPSGWTEAADYTFGSNARIWVFWKVLVSGDLTTHTWSWSPTSAKTKVCYAVFTGATSAEPTAGTWTDVNTGTGITFANYTTNFPFVICRAGVYSSNSTRSATPPSSPSFTEPTTPSAADDWLTNSDFMWEMSYYASHTGGSIQPTGCTISSTQTNRFSSIIAITDSPQVNVTEAIAVTETTSKYLDTVYVGESVTVTRSEGGPAPVEVQVLTEGVTVGEARTVFLPYLTPSVAEPVGVGEAVTLSTLLAPVIQEPITVGESRTLATLLTIVVNEPVTVGESAPALALGLTATVNEPVSVGEAPTVKVPVLYPTVQEPISVGESRTVQLNPLVVSIAETVTVGEVPSVSTGSRNIAVTTEGVNVGEAPSVLVPELKPRVDEPVTAADALIRVQTNPCLIAVTEPVSVGEERTVSRQAEGAYDINIPESVTVGEVPTVSLPVLNATATEPVGVADALTRVQLNPLLVSVTEGVSVAEVPTVSRAAPGEVAVFEPVNVADSLIRVQVNPLHITINEAVSVTEAAPTVQLNPLCPAKVNENITVTESAPTVLLGENKVVVNEPVTVGESRTVICDPCPVLGQNVTVTETVTVLVPALKVIATETITLGEANDLLIPELKVKVIEPVQVADVLTRILLYAIPSWQMHTAGNPRIHGNRVAVLSGNYRGRFHGGYSVEMEERHDIDK